MFLSVRLRSFFSNQLRNADVLISWMEWVHSDLYHKKIQAMFLRLMLASLVDRAPSSLWFACESSPLCHVLCGEMKSAFLVSFLDRKNMTSALACSQDEIVDGFCSLWLSAWWLAGLTGLSFRIC